MAEGTLVGLGGATESAALLSALGPRGVLEMSALGPCGTAVLVCARNGHVIRTHLFSARGGGVDGVDLLERVPTGASGSNGGLLPCPGAVDHSTWESGECWEVHVLPCDSSTPRWGTAVDVPTVIVGEGGTVGRRWVVEVPRWAVVR